MFSCVKYTLINNKQDAKMDKRESECRYLSLSLTRNLITNIKSGPSHHQPSFSSSASQHLSAWWYLVSVWDAVSFNRNKWFSASDSWWCNLNSLEFLLRSPHTEISQQISHWDSWLNDFKINLDSNQTKEFMKVLPRNKTKEKVYLCPYSEIIV